ncbi:hypothetical protein SMALA_3169 [Streptomyces malaysiensis subsp. malaysiensis]|nr:hypothetical protein SMALA_3169 [Streptomyces malaysiensis]
MTLYAYLHRPPSGKSTLSIFAEFAELCEMFGYQAAG